jgi:predicted porin
MKTKKIEIIVGSLVGLASSVAHSQSSVTLYGEIDNGIHYQTNVGGGKAVYMDSLDGIDGSRWGLTGKEDLGGGLKAIFTLESGINVNNGQFAQGGTAFGRQAFVGLSSDTYGSLTAGRQYDMVWYFPEFLAGSAAVGDLPSAHPGDFDNTSNSVRFNNSVRYMSPDFRGFSFGVEYSLGGVPGDFTSTSGYSLGVGYTHGPLQIGAAFDYFKHPTSTPGNGWFTNYASGFNLLASSELGLSGRAGLSGRRHRGGLHDRKRDDQRIVFERSIRQSRRGVHERHRRLQQLRHRVELPCHAGLFVGVAYDYMNARSVTTAQGNAVGNQHYNQVAFTLDYLLSKRTDVYLSGGWQRASGTSSTGAPAVANIGGSGDSSNNHQMVYRLAIRHKF